MLFAQPLVQQEPRSPLTVLGCPGNASLLPLLFKSILFLVCINPGAKASSLTRLVNLHLPLSLINEANFIMKPSDFRFMDVPLKIPRECLFSILCEGERWWWGRGRRMLLLDPASDSLSFLPLWISEEESHHRSHAKYFRLSTTQTYNYTCFSWCSSEHVGLATTLSQQSWLPPTAAPP